MITIGNLIMFMKVFFFSEKSYNHTNHRLGTSCR